MIIARYQLSNCITPRQFADNPEVEHHFHNLVGFADRYGEEGECKDFRISIINHWAVLWFHNGGQLELEADNMQDEDITFYLQYLSDAFFTKMTATHPTSEFPNLPRVIKPRRVN